MPRNLSNIRSNCGSAPRSGASVPASRPPPSDPRARTPEPLLHTVKEMADALDRSEDYVTNMKRGGFKLPATLTEAVAFIRANGPPTRFRLYSHEKK